MQFTTVARLMIAAAGVGIACFSKPLAGGDASDSRSMPVDNIGNPTPAPSPHVR